MTGERPGLSPGLSTAEEEKSARKARGAFPRPWKEADFTNDSLTPSAAGRPPGQMRSSRGLSQEDLRQSSPGEEAEPDLCGRRPDPFCLCRLLALLLSS